MLDERQPEGARIFERAAHHVGVHHRHAVVADGDDAGVLHLAHLRQGLAFGPPGGGADGVDAHAARLARFDARQLPPIVSPAPLGDDVSRDVLHDQIVAPDAKPRFSAKR